MSKPLTGDTIRRNFSTINTLAQAEAKQIKTGCIATIEGNKVVFWDGLKNFEAYVYGNARTGYMFGLVKDAK